MKYVRTWVAIAALFFITPALAQWQVPNNAIPLGRGVGAVGFGSILNSGSGALCLRDTVPPSFGNCDGDYQIISGLTSDQFITTAPITTVNGSPNVTIVGGVGTCTVGKSIVIPNVGTPSTGGSTTDYNRLTAVITGISGNTVTLNTSPQRSLTQSAQFNCGTDNTTPVQTAIIAQSNSMFAVNTNILIISDITIPGNRAVYVPNQATVTSAGRFTAAASGISSVDWVVNGRLQSVGMADGANLGLGWANFGGYAERGFLEFGGASTTVGGVSGNRFSVSGTGTVCGDFPSGATPNLTNSGWQINKKGIAAFFASDVRVTVREVCGFHGESVYYNTANATDKSVLFNGIFVHDVRFNGPNINIAASVPADNGFVMSNNRVYNAFSCFEFDAGMVENNHCDTFSWVGYNLGLGSDFGPISIVGNTAKNGTNVPDAGNPVCGITGGASVGFCLSSSNTGGFTPGKNINVTGNVVETVGASCYMMNAGSGATKISNVALSSNTCRDYAKGTAAYGYDFQKTDYLSGYGNTATDPGAFSLGGFFGNNNTNVTLAPVTPPTVGLQVFNNTTIANWLAPGASGIPVVSDGTTFVAGQVSTAGIANAAVTYVKMQNVSANQRLLGLSTGAPASPIELAISTALDWISSTQGSALYRGASAWTVLAPGTANQLWHSGTTPTLGAVVSLDLNIDTTNCIGTFLTAISNHAAGTCSNLPVLTFGSHLNAGAASYNGSAIATVTSDATSANTPSTIVARNASGDIAVSNVAATTFNGNAWTVGTGTLTIAAGKTLTDTSGAGVNLLLGAAGGGFAAYPGSGTCSANAFAVSFNSTGGITCAALAAGSVTNAMLAGSIASSNLAATTVTAASYGSSTSIPSLTVNAQGQLTAAAGNAVIAPAGTLSGTVLNPAVVTSSLTSLGTIVSLIATTITDPVHYGGSGAASTLTLASTSGAGVPAPDSIIFQTGSQVVSGRIISSTKASIGTISAVNVFAGLVVGADTGGFEMSGGATTALNSYNRNGSAYLPHTHGAASFDFTIGASAGSGLKVWPSTGASLAVNTDPGAGNLLVTGKIQTGKSTVASLPTCNAAAEGSMYGVTDALAPTFLGTLVGGGTVHTAGYCNGTNWVGG